MQSLINSIDYFNELEDIKSDNKIPIDLKYSQLRTLLEKATKELTKNEVLQFSNLFARLAFICEKRQLPTKIHALRVTANKVLHESYKPSISEYDTHLKYLCEFLSKGFGIEVPDNLVKAYPEIEHSSPKISHKGKRLVKLRAEVIFIEVDKLICTPEDETYDAHITVSLTDLDAFKSVQKFWQGAQIYLVNIVIDDDNIFHPKFIILEPDYLIDISSIAECNQDYGKSELFYLKSKFEAIPNSKHIRLGNFANRVIDELFAENNNEPKLFRDVLGEDFQAYPLEYTTCSDFNDNAEFKKYMMDAEMHFTNLKRVVYNDFKKYDISIENASLEPAFLSEAYGIQGRLDILELSDNGKPKIVELKSGGAPFPDDGMKIKPNHQSQLFLYYQLIALQENISFNKISSDIDGYILYSKINKNNMRLGRNFLYLKGVQSIFEIRNKILINEHLLTQDDIKKTQELISNISPSHIINGFNVNPKFKEKYLEPQINALTKPIVELDELEQKYFYSFINFIAKEQYLAKLGESENEFQSGNGLANLWLNSFPAKVENFEILYDLTISKNLIAAEEKEITLIRKDDEDEFVNFRKGDICILYPRNKKTDDVTRNQIFKCNIKKITKDEVVVSFRYKQRNTKFFEQFDTANQNGLWALERDFMDSSFRAMYKNLYSFIAHKEKRKRQLLLTTQKPVENSLHSYQNNSLSQEQNRVIQKALSAKDYFLLNGPPGTGKTSMIIKELVRELHKEEGTNILLLAYTNRAVDEICEAVNNAIINFDDINDGTVNSGRTDRNFIRIGSEPSCGEDYKHNLLSNICNGIKTRDALKEILNKHRIYISTVASMASKMDIFKLKQFDTIIIDEASQILEPQIIGILPNCKKFILIGDHKQLPAIVLQSRLKSATNNKLLESIGLVNRKNSLFERLYTFCEKENLSHAYDKLSYQGRMHKEIGLFPSYSFYESELHPLFEIPNLPEEHKEKADRQKAKLNLQSSTKNTLEDLLTKKRLLFFQSTRGQNENNYGKKNKSEAELVVKIIKEIKSIYQDNKLPFDDNKTIGVIAPFRNQIALIKQELEKAEVPNHDKITVDTVERYQGSQRDIIILSFAINNPYHLNGMINMNDDGTVDRKLNVALTRAKEQLILIGNDSILSTNLIYFKLIEFIKSKGGYISESIDDVIKGKLNFEYFDSEETVEGKMYAPEQEFKDVFDNSIINVLINDSRTDNYPKSILGVSNDFIRNNIIEYGRSDFDSDYQESLFSPNFSKEDKVNLYCFYNMRKHYFSSYAIFESYKDFFSIELKQTSGRITFVDFGCGPITSGIAFNQIFKHDIENYHLKYIGVDISKAMLHKGEEFSKTELFLENTYFNFIKSIKDLNKGVMEEFYRLSNTVILNFSYIFANLDSEQTNDLALEINKMVADFPLNKYIIVYQNPKHRHHNFTKFKNRLKGFGNSIVRKSETVSYKNNEQSRYDKSETYTYEILTN